MKRGSDSSKASSVPARAKRRFEDYGESNQSISAASMKFILYAVDSILRLLFGLLLVCTLVVTMMSARNALHHLSFQARTRLPFGVTALLLAVFALWYGHSLYGTFFTAMITAWEAVSLLQMTKQLILSYVLYAGFALLVVPALILADIWWSFHRASVLGTLAPDRRSPVLLLRSFEGDESDAGPSRDLERALSRVIGRKLGPLIALGSQADFNPPSGARRTYADDADWQAKVMEFIEVATAIVFVVSKWTPSVRWEMEQVRARSLLSKTGERRIESVEE